MKPLMGRVTVCFFVVALAAAACGGGSSSSTSTGTKPSRGFTAHPDPGYTFVTYKGTPISWGQTTTLPRLVCPPSHPYVFNLRGNTNTTFRISPGISFSDWSWGFDASVYGDNEWLSQPAPNGQVRIGLKGEQHYDLNSVSYWSPYPAKSNWTVSLQCTSFLNQAVYQGGPGIGW